jgi:hypothetical protein
MVCQMSLSEAMNGLVCLGGEQYDWKNFTEGRWASSAAHFYGKRRVLAEYATWAGIPNRFIDTLDNLKQVADLQFLTGLTELGTVDLAIFPAFGRCSRVGRLFGR